ncbi:MAG: phosphoesterase [Planctomycetes bacterium]|nr:phosphoesterase [Planctomycetota bacterium]
MRRSPLLPFLLFAACATDDPGHVVRSEARVGPGTDRSVTPVNQELTPAGRQIQLPGMRPQGLALTPDGKSLLIAGKTKELVVIDAATGEIRQRVALPSDQQKEPPVASANILKPDKDGQLSYTGLIIAPDGKRAWLSSVNGSIKVFTIAADGMVAASHSLVLPDAKAPRRDAEIPSGLALTADGQRLLVCGNLSNQLLELDATTGAVRRTFAVGVAPFDVVIAGNRAFVSNQGGRRPGAGDLVGPAGRGTTVRVDPIRHIANEGSVTMIDLTRGEVVREVLTGLHPSALAVSPDGHHVVCANAMSDNLTVLDATTGDLIETIWCKPKPSDLLSVSPNALAFAPDGRTLYVAHGTQNAIGVVHFDPEDRGDSRLHGLIPVGWYPGAVVFDQARGQLHVANIKGLGPGRAQKDGEGIEHNSHQYHGTLSSLPLPDADTLTQWSARVQHNLRAPAIRAALQPPRSGVAPRAIPERSGEPSLIEHVVYVIKENRTYDQVLGDLPQGNGDPSLCIFGEALTPNQHALARQFVLLDNTYCAGILSADGHQWSTTAFATDYLERSFAGFPRSYPDGMGEDEKDALAYAPSGFLWDHAIARGLPLRNYGEFCEPLVRWRDGRSGTPEFRACYLAWKNGTDDVVFESKPVVPSLEPFSPTGYVGWEMSVPDQHRADHILRELAEYEARGAYPRLTIICLPQDHTSGTSRGCPTPAACVADNDLALGRIVEALSRSRFWPKMAIFAIEDDPQAGWDHVSGYRTTAYVASPFARRGAVVSTQYNTTSILRTIGLILGLPPMNAFDASATPMHDCFQDIADLTPFSALPASVPLDQLNPEPAAIADPVLRADAELSATMNFAQVDRAPEDALNRILWRAMRGSSVPYPEWAITPGAEEEEEAEEARERAGR